MKRIIASVVLLCILLSTVACAQSSGTPDDTTKAGENTSAVADTTPVTTEDPIRLKIPETIDYKEYEFVIANGFHNDTKYTTNAIAPESLNADVLNDAIYYRTKKVEEELNIKVVDIAYTATQMKNSLMANANEFDLMTVNLSDVRTFINLKAVHNFYDFPGIDITMPWWDQNAQQKLSVGGKLFHTFSDFLITHLDNSRAVYYNKELRVDLKLEDPNQLVRDNKWTLDKMREMGLTAVSDLNGDGKYTQDDRFGMLCWNATSFYEAYLTGSDAEIMKQGENGVPYFYCLEQPFVDVYNKLLDVFNTDNMTLLVNNLDLFKENKSLFTTWTLYGATRLRSMDTDFGILPVPKYDENQESYWHVSPAPHALMLPITMEDEQRTGYILEALSYYSSSSYSDDTVIPAYFEKAVKGKGARDEESAEMLDLIKNSISYIIKLDNSSLTDLIYSSFGAANRNLTSNIEKVKATALKKLEESFAAMEITP